MTDNPPRYGASFQPIGGMIRAGLGHVSYISKDPVTFCTWLQAEGHNYKIAHMYGAIQWYDDKSDHPAVKACIDLCRSMGFRIAIWEKVDPETKEVRDVEIWLGKRDPVLAEEMERYKMLTRAEQVGEFSIPGAQ